MTTETEKEMSNIVAFPEGNEYFLDGLVLRMEDNKVHFPLWQKQVVPE